MSKNLTIQEKLIKKYHKCEKVTNLKQLLYRSSDIYGSRIAFKLKNDKGEIYPVSYKEFKQDIVQLGTYLIELGFLGKRIAVIGKNSYQWAVSYFASTIVGIVVPLDKELHDDDVINFLNISESVCVLGDTKNLNGILEKKSNLTNQDICMISLDLEKKSNFAKFDSLEHSEVYYVNDCISKGKEFLIQGNNDFDTIEVDPDEMRILLFTSGTTGNAKGVCLSHRNVCSNITSIYGIVKVKRSDLFFSILPLHHTYECTIGFLLPLYSGASICYCDGLRYILKNIGEYHPSVILCVPLLLENMHKNIIKNMNKTLPKKYVKSPNENPYDNLPGLIKHIVKSKVKNTLGGRLRVFIVGAASVNPSIVADFEKLGLLTLQGYGLTECSPLVAGNNDFYHKDDSCGLPIPDVTYKIDSPNENGDGEILVKGPNVMLGYYNMPDETAKVLKDGWFHTGDIGRIDDQGFLYITGRCKSVIVTKNGKNIYPEEVEYYLNDNPLVSESLVLGIQKDDDDETYINAQILPNIEAITEYLKGAVPTKDEIKKIMSDIVASVNSKLPNYKHIKGFIIRDKEFEKTTTQKITFAPLFGIHSTAIFGWFSLQNSARRLVCMIFMPDISIFSREILLSKIPASS